MTNVSPGLKMLVLKQETKYFLMQIEVINVGRMAFLINKLNSLRKLDLHVVT